MERIAGLRGRLPVLLGGLGDRVYAGLLTVSVYVWNVVVGLFAWGQGSPVLARVRSHRRGAGMLEYALIAAIAVGVFIFLRGFLNDLFGRVTGDIGRKLQDPVQSPVGTIAP